VEKLIPAIRLSLIVVLSAALAFIPFGISVAPASARQEPIRVSVELVNILASVMDTQNRPITSLTKDSFQIFDDGVPQKISIFEAETHLPLDLALMIDASGSTRLDYSQQVQAASEFIRKVVRTGDSLAVFSFDQDVHVLADFSSDVPHLQHAVHAIKKGGGTSMYDAIYLGAQTLSKRKTDRRRVIVLVTDAGESTSKASFETARNQAVRSGAMMYTVVLRPVKSESGRNTAGEHALQTITETTGGYMFFPDGATRLDDIFSQIDRELRTQYRIGYYPERKSSGNALRKIDLHVDGDFKMRYRQAYIPPDDKP
jgi:Ca-activated chloride channel family protein